MTIIVAETEAVSPKITSPKQLAAIISASAAVVVAATAGIVTPIVVGTIEHSHAVAAYGQAFEANAEALESLEEATRSVAAARSDALSIVTPTERIATIIRDNGQMFDGTELATTLDAAVSDVLDVALISRTEANGIALDQIAPTYFPIARRLGAEASTEELQAGATEIVELTDRIRTQADDRIVHAVAIHTAIETVEITRRQVVDAAVAAGTAWQSPDRTTDGAWNEFQTTMAALRTATASADIDAILENYALARSAANMVRDDQVAAE